MDNDILLEIQNLKTYFYYDEGVVKAVDGVDFNIGKGVMMGLVGESGSGKSVTVRSIMQLIEPPGKIVKGKVLYYMNDDVIDITQFGRHSQEMRELRGEEIALVFQEPMSAFSPVHTIGFQIVEAIRLHENTTEKEARERAINLLDQVGLSAPAERFEQYPFELSGGMRQRAFIAMALSCYPNLLIADEPTTAVDVTIQAQILDLLEDLRQEFSMSVLLITHDLGVIAEITEEVAVMYLGKIMEKATVDQLFHNPKHPYTKSLLKSIPELDDEREFLEVIEGTVPDPYSIPAGCPFVTRCKERQKICNQNIPPEKKLENGQIVRCWHYSEEGDLNESEAS